ncbi:MAG: hypothetical protein JXQ76_12910, partial [Campylobacterales bacterium]|nr:hypothetical protein [Campylobacterales bacterium]
HPIMKNIMIGKYHGTSNNQAEIGLLSKIELSDNDIEKTLGSAASTVLIEDNNLTERIHDLYHNYKSTYPKQ